MKSKNPYAREQWLAAKKLYRPIQVWVWDNKPKNLGHWEHGDARR